MYLELWQWFIILFSVILVFVVLFYFYFRAMRISFSRINRLSHMLQDYHHVIEEYSHVKPVKLEQSETDRKTIVEIIKEKKERFSNVTSVSFHFVDKDEIENFYNDTFREPTIESLVSEITGEITGGVKGSIPKILESKIGSRDISKWISTLKLPETSLSGMFIKYQKEAIKRDEVTLGLEELDVELNELQKFDSIVENLKTNFSFEIEHKTLDIHRSKIRQKAAETTLSKLESSTGLVLIEGKFLISKKENIYDCILTHPVNKFLLSEAKEIKILFSLPVESIESRYAGNYAGSVGRMIPLRVFGKVWQPIDRNIDVWDLQITPLAVY